MYGQFDVPVGGQGDRMQQHIADDVPCSGINVDQGRAAVFDMHFEVQRLARGDGCDVRSQSVQCVGQVERAKTPLLIHHVGKSGQIAGEQKQLVGGATNGVDLLALFNRRSGDELSDDSLLLG